ASIHAIRDIKYAGIFADPRTDHRGYALGFETDSSLAVNIARYIHTNGGYVPGNRLDSNPKALYHSDPIPAPYGQWQERNLLGSKLPYNRGQGVSLGSWATTAIHDP